MKLIYDLGNPMHLNRTYSTSFSLFFFLYGAYLLSYNLKVISDHTYAVGKHLEASNRNKLLNF